MKKKDLIIICILAVVMLSTFIINKYINSGNATMVEIYYNNAVYKRLPIDKDESVVIEENGEKNIISIKNKSVKMESATCPDLICVKTGSISKPGESITCLPHKINIKIVGESSDEDTDVKVK